MPFPGNMENNTAGSPAECFYYGPGPYVAEFQNVRRVNTGVFNVPHNMTAAQMGQARNTQGNLMSGPNQMSGIDPRYLAGYIDNAQYVLAGQQTQRNPTPIISSFGNEYQNRSFTGPDRNKIKDFTPVVMNLEAPRVEAMPKPPVASYDAKNIEKNDAPHCKTVSTKKPNELDLLRNDGQNQLFTRAEKLKALNKSGPRVFSGPVEKVLKWHKSLQDIGVLILYEIVAKCVNVRAGESCSKNLVIRDDGGPAMQVVYYEIDFLLPELKPPCTIRVIGRMVSGTCRLQAFNVRPATGDDVAMLPRRAAVAAHHVAKLCNEYGHNA